MRSRLSLLLLAAAALCVSSASAQNTINNLSLPSYAAPGYVIGADAVDGVGATNRHVIDTSCQITINTPGAYAIQWSLVAPDNSVMATSTSTAGTITPPMVPDTRTVTGGLTPAVSLPLQVGVFYRLHAQLVNTGTSAIADTRTQPTGFTYIHLKGTDPASTALNVVSEITSVVINREFLLETNPALTTIPVTVSYRLHRYDNWDAANDPKPVVVNLDSTALRLHSDGSLKPSTITNGIFPVPGVNSFTGAGPRVPATVTGTRIIQVDPTSILPPQTYRIEPKITHLEDSPAIATGNALSSAPAFITHFTGQLNFGSIVTHFTSLAAAPVGLPSVIFPGDTSHKARIAPNANSGTVDGITDYHYGDGTLINVSLDDNGVASDLGEYTFIPTMVTYTSGPVLLVPDTAAARDDSLNGIVFKRTDDITLDETGAHGFIKAWLPVGTGWAATRYVGLLDDEIDFGAEDLNQSLDPLANPSISPGAGAFYLCEETKPVYIECQTFAWATALGEFQAGALSNAHSIRRPLLEFLASYIASYPDVNMAVKKSNDHLYNRVSSAANAKVKLGASGGGEMSTVLSVTASSFLTHFPHGTLVQWTAPTSSINVVGDLLSTTLGSLDTADPVVVTYAQHCQDALENGCGTTVTSTATLTSATGNLKLTNDGGIRASGTVAMTSLAWGAIPSTSPQEYAHKVVTSFSDATFLMAGTFLRGDMNALGDNDGPGVLLLSGVDPTVLETEERPETTPYQVGLADYAGLNFRATSGLHDGESTLQGDPYGPYDLTTRSKYYIRLSGVTGIHEAPDAGFPGTATIGGYMFSLTKYGFSFLSNDMEETRTAGSLDLPDPTDFTLAFTELTLSCLGALEGFEITGAGTVDSKEFDFWDALFTPFSAAFVSTNTCIPGDGTTLVLGFGAHASHFADAINGSLGIRPSGEFATQNELNIGAVGEAVPVRITLPGSMLLVGTTGESYDFFPNQGAYLNNSVGASEGFWSLFGTIDVPFFKDMQVHLHSRCLSSGIGIPETLTPIYMMGGWPSNGWTEGVPLVDPFTTTGFDVNHTGYTGTLAAYRKTTDDGSETYLPRAQQFWLELIDFDYPVKWSNTAFNFSGRGPVNQDLIALTTQTELLYLDAENTELTFGLRYEGLPEISLTNFVINAVDDVTGVSSALVTAAGQEVFDSLQSGVDELADAVSDEADDLLGTALTTLTDPLLDDLIDELKTTITAGGYTSGALTGIITPRLGAASSLTTALNDLGDPVSNLNGFLNNLKTRLMNIENSIDAIINGLLKIDAGEDRRLVFESLAAELVDVLSTLVDSSAISDQLNDLIQDQSATLDSVTATLTSVKATVTAVRLQIEGATDLGEELQELVSGAGGQIDINAVTAAVNTAANDLVLGATTQDLENLDEVADEWRAEIAQMIKDELYAKPLVADIQESVKERIYDVQASFNEAVDTAFASLNAAVREALSDVLAGLDESINQLEGSFADAIGAGSITGFAHINGDSLDLLRLDAMVEMNLPDAMTLAGYFQIKELDSDGPGTCIPGTVGANTVEIMIGVEDVSLAWVGLGLNGDVRADMDVKFGISGGAPVSLGGAFEMTNGTIDFETFEIYELGASVMFGDTENYIAASVGVNLADYSMAGGIFLGKSCDLEPLELIDPLVASVITTPSITGIYAYGAATFPIVGGGCFFNISAKVGAGVFVFSEGPTFGGRMDLGIYGEALCVVEVGGEIALVGVKSGAVYSFAGTGRVFGKAGICPICTEADFQVDFKYTTSGGWDVNY